MLSVVVLVLVLSFVVLVLVLDIIDIVAALLCYGWVRCCSRCVSSLCVALLLDEMFCPKRLDPVQLQEQQHTQR